MVGARLSKFLMSFLPTYEQASMLGPAGLVILRIARGLFLGDEYSASGILAVENTVRRKGLAEALCRRASLWAS